MSIQSGGVLKTFDWLIANFLPFGQCLILISFFFEKVDVFILNLTRKKLKNLIFKNVFLCLFFFFWKIWKAE